MNIRAFPQKDFEMRKEAIELKIADLLHKAKVYRAWGYALLQEACLLDVMALRRKLNDSD